MIHQSIGSISLKVSHLADMRGNVLPDHGIIGALGDHRKKQSQQRPGRDAAKDKSLQCAGIGLRQRKRGSGGGHRRIIVYWKNPARFTSRCDGFGVGPGSGQVDVEGRALAQF